MRADRPGSSNSKAVSGLLFDGPWRSGPWPNTEALANFFINLYGRTGLNGDGEAIADRLIKRAALLTAEYPERYCVSIDEGYGAFTGIANMEQRAPRHCLVRRLPGHPRNPEPGIRTVRSHLQLCPAISLMPDVHRREPSQRHRQARGSRTRSKLGGRGMR